MCLENIVVHGDTHDLTNRSDDDGQGDGSSDEIVRTDDREDNLTRKQNTSHTNQTETKRCPSRADVVGRNSCHSTQTFNRA